MSIIWAYSRYSSHQYASFLIMVAHDTLTLVRTDTQVDMRVIMSKATTMEDMATKLATDPMAMKKPLEVYSAASIARGLLGVIT